MKKLLLVAAALITSAFLSNAIFAHHSTAGFQTDKAVRIEGTITKFRWTNPHASFKIEGSAEGFEDSLWSIEMTAPNVLKNSGWKRSSLKKGDKVVVFANPTVDDSARLGDGSRGGLYVGVILADGTSLGRVDGEAGRE